MKICTNSIGLFVAVSAFLTACGGGGSQPTNTTPPKTLQATIIDLGSSGKLPALDRSASIAGPDANDNGIRDDVDAFINNQGYNAAQLKSTQQTARAIGKILIVNTKNQDELRASDLNLQKSIKCVFSKFSDVNQSAAAIKNIQKITVNSKARIETYIKYQVAMDGKVLASPQGETCE